MANKYECQQRKKKDQKADWKKDLGERLEHKENPDDDPSHAGIEESQEPWFRNPAAVVSGSGNDQRDIS